MRTFIYKAVVTYPKIIVGVVFALTIFFAMQLDQLRWETDARVYMPPGHPAIKYDEEIERIFGVKDAIVVVVENEEEGIYNYETLSRVKRITDKIAALPQIVANRDIDVVSLSTAVVFSGANNTLGSKQVMNTIPESEAEMNGLKAEIQKHADILIGNIVSEDGTATMIRAKVKEGITNRYSAFFAIKAITDAELGKTPEWGNNWNNSSDWGQGSWDNNPKAGEEQTQQSLSDESVWGEEVEWSDSIKVESADATSQAGESETQAQSTNQWGNGASWPTSTTSQVEDAVETNDAIYIAGRPVIEVTNGLHGLKDLKVMLPLLGLAIVAALFLLFSTLRAVLLPLFIVGASIVWTLGMMVLFDVPMYTISTMLPVVLVAVGLGHAVHLLGHYYDVVLQDPHRPSKEIVTEVLEQLKTPIAVTSLTTAVGFSSLLLADMPPFHDFGMFTVVGILSCWALSVTFLPAMLVILQPKVGNYLAKRRAMRVHNEQGRIVKYLVDASSWLIEKKKQVSIALVAILAISIVGGTQLFVNSSWMSDFKKDTEISISTDVINTKFDGSIFLNIIVETNKVDAIKDPVLLKKMEALQAHVETVDYVGDSISIVDYLKSMHKTINHESEAFNVLPDSRDLIAEYIFLFSISGRPEQLDEVVDYDYKTANITFAIQTDETKHLEHIISEAEQFIAQEFPETGASLNMAGSGNNSYVWADLLIDSQTKAIVFSKVAILILVFFIMRSFPVSILVIVPVTFATILVAGVAGFLRIPLDVSTALAAGVAIGVGVDYAVHFIFRYMRELQAVDDEKLAIQNVMRGVGKTIVFNALVVSAGFMVLFFSEFPPNIKLGYFVASYMIISCVVALMTLPVLFLQFSNKLKPLMLNYRVQQ